MQTQTTDPSQGPVPSKNSFHEVASNFGDLLRFGILVIAIVVVVRGIIAQPFIVSGTSMVPTFQNKDYLVIDQLTYRFSEPHRGDVVVFRPPYNKSIFLIKRIIGVPGDTVTVKNGIATITNADHPNGIQLSDGYTTPDTLIEDITTVVTEGNYFVMGDNRPASYDSRRWGLLPKKNITGRAFLRVFPIKQFDFFPGEQTILP